MDINCRKLSEYISDRLLMDQLSGKCYVVRRQEQYECVYAVLLTFTKDYLRYIDISDLKQLEHWSDVRKQVLHSICIIIEGQNMAVGLDTLLMVFGTIKMYMDCYQTHSNSERFITYLRNELTMIYSILSKLWHCPTNSHRVLLQKSHLHAIIGTIAE